MAEISIKIANLPQIKSAFARAPSLMGRHLNLAIKKSLLNIEADSRRNTPVLTGRLRASHYTLFQPLKGEVGTHTDYDIFVHEGTRFMRARPYLRTAVQSNQPTVDRYFGDAVQTVLNEIGRAT